MKMADQGEYFLLPLDANCSERIPIPDGETTLGRGPFLKITDKRVSRSHATLTNKGGRLSLRLKHTNPCFYKAVGSTAYIQLQKDEEQVLSQGDCFSFLPNSLRFELQHVPAVTTEVDGNTACATEAAHEEDQDGKEEDEVGPSEQVKLLSPSEEEWGAPEADTDTRQKDVDTHLIDLTHQADGDIPQADVNKHQADVDKHQIDLTHQADGDIPQADVDKQQVDVETHQTDAELCLKSLGTSVTAEREGKSDNTVESDSSAVVVGCLGKKRRLPGWLSMGSMDGKREEETRGSKKKRAAKGKAPAVASKLPAKRRARISSDEEEKKSPPTTKRSRKKASSEPPRVLDASGGKDDEEFSEQVPRATKSPPTDKSPPSADKRPFHADKSLPPCPYGESCYRKNPAHFREYSHPQGDNSTEEEDSDALSDADSRPECPYGTACYRRNTLHRQQYKHSAAPAVESLPRSSRAKRKRPVTTRKGRSTVCDGESDDDGLPNTYDYDDSFIDDDDDDGANNSTSSGGDDSDEDWQHPGGDGGGEESEEDIQELAKEADEFVSNSKLHRH